MLVFIPHRYPCISSQRPQPPGDFYPAGARRRFEEGSVILRTKMNANGCGLATAIVVSTGSPDLDQAGLETAQFTRFAPATEGGKPIASELTYSVKFVLKD
jgi:protein TonB